jgi:hypothetical protein
MQAVRKVKQPVHTTHAHRYREIVACQDAAGNKWTFLHREIIDFQDSRDLLPAATS